MSPLKLQPAWGSTGLYTHPSSYDLDVPASWAFKNCKQGCSLTLAACAQVTYEAYGAGGTGFIAECLTDNVNRSATDVRTAIVKAGGKMADSGSVLFNFQRCGVVLVTGSSEEEVTFCHELQLCSKQESNCRSLFALRFTDY